MSITFTSDQSENLEIYTDGVTSAEYDYDALNRKVSETVNYGDFSKTYSYTYYANGQTFTMPDGPTYEYFYGDNNELKKIRIPGQGEISYPSYTLNRPDSVTFPGGSSQSYQYDALLRLERLSAPDSGLDYQYTYDNVSNILTKTTEHGNYGYGYDDIYRLTSADNPIQDDEAYTYDGVGNRETASGVSGSITHNENNELMVYGEIAYEYDANGNMIRKSIGSAAVNYIYNVENRLIRVEDELSGTVIAEYAYDPFGRRLWKDVDGVRTYFFYADEGLVAEYDESGAEIRSYGYQPDSFWTANPLFLKEDGVYYWYQNDHVGTPQKLTAMDGTVVWSAMYNSFGAADIQIEAVTNNLRFPGQYYDVEIGLHYNFHRYYNPLSGRYVRTDPIGFEGGDVNLYAYVLSNSVNMVDPWGLYRSYWLLRALVPGQVAWDNAVTAFESGNYGGAALYTAAMLGEQLLVAYMWGQASALVQAGSSVLPTGADLVTDMWDVPLPELPEKLFEILDKIRNGGGDCDWMARMLIRELEEGELITLLTKGGGDFPARPGLPRTPWNYHTAVRLPNGQVADPLLGQVSSSVDEFINNIVTNPENIQIMINGAIQNN